MQHKVVINVNQSRAVFIKWVWSFHICAIKPQLRKHLAIWYWSLLVVLFSDRDCSFLISFRSNRWNAQIKFSAHLWKDISVSTVLACNRLQQKCHRLVHHKHILFRLKPWIYSLNETQNGILLKQLRERLVYQFIRLKLTRKYDHQFCDSKRPFTWNRTFLDIVDIYHHNGTRNTLRPSPHLQM